MGLGSSKPDSPPPTAPPPRRGGASLAKLPEALQAQVFDNLSLDCRLVVQTSNVALATTDVPFASSKAYGLSSRVMRARVRPLKRLQAMLGLKSVALKPKPVVFKPKSPVKKKTVTKKSPRKVRATPPVAAVSSQTQGERPTQAGAPHPQTIRRRAIRAGAPKMKSGGQPGNKNARRVLVHRFDPKTGKKMGKSTSMRGIAVMWLKYPKGYKGEAGVKALKPSKAKNGVWAVRALGPGQKAGGNFGRPGRTGELMYFREG